MKKIAIVAATLLAASSFAYAEQTQSTDAVQVAPESNNMQVADATPAADAAAPAADAAKDAAAPAKKKMKKKHCCGGKKHSKKAADAAAPASTDAAAPAAQ